MAPKARHTVVAVVSDLHCGSTLGMVPPEGVRLDDGGTYEPSKVQQWLWTCWEDFWGEVRTLKQQHKAQLYTIFNGDFFDGDHHRTTQIVSANPETQDYIADRVYSVPRALKAAEQFMIRGTEAHVGASGAVEESFARRHRMTRNPEDEAWSWWHLEMEINGILVEAQHHGKMGQLPWTKSNAVMQQAAHVFMERATRGVRHPDVSFRSHMHRWADSYKAQPTRLIQTPAWQMKTAFAHKVAPNSPPDIGGIVMHIPPNGKYTIEEHLYVPEERAPWRAKS